MLQAAVKAASAALQKHKGNQVLRALKALAQQRCGNEAEGLKARWRAAFRSTHCSCACTHTVQWECGRVQACADLQQEVPTDTQVLNLLAIVLKAAGQQKELAALYAAASAARPKNAELLRGLFAAHVACGPRASSYSRVAANH